MIYIKHHLVSLSNPQQNAEGGGGDTTPNTVSYDLNIYYNFSSIVTPGTMRM